MSQHQWRMGTIDWQTVVPSEWIGPAKIWVTELRICKRCSAQYLEANNLGQWRCYCHPREYNHSRDGEFKRKGQWDCCGETSYNENRPHINGCKRADHIGMERKSEVDVPQSRIQSVHISIISCGLIESPLPETLYTQPSTSPLYKDPNIISFFRVQQ